MRTVFGIGLVLALAVGAAQGQDKKGQDKFDPAKLVGRWAPKDVKPGEGLTLEFADKGKLAVLNKVNGKDVKIDGTYKLDGEKLSFTLKFMDIEVKDTITLTKLTDDEMVGKDKEGKEETFKRAAVKK